jgi:DNA-binding transcriptional ArsR family regulator
MSPKGLQSEIKVTKTSGAGSDLNNFVLDKGIFSNIFEKDIRRVYIYKKVERLAKALILISPAFKDAHTLKARVERLSVELIDASLLTPLAARDALSKELLALSSVLSMARTAGLLSTMNAELIAREAHLLLKEVAVYEEPKLSFDETPSLAVLLRDSVEPRQKNQPKVNAGTVNVREENKGQNGVVKDRGGRREAILSVLEGKGPSFIKDISTVIRDVSEKTIQRELQNLVLEGVITREGERRWTTYSLTSNTRPI